MRHIVFYSWQSDLPNGTNRSFIERALKDACQAIASDNTVDVEPVIDRDTQGIPGAPDIAKAIFEKIKAADVFVADISIINNRQEGRPAPNPNVLIELGYALHALGEERVVLIFNEAWGKLEQLPFDLKMRRAIPFSVAESLTDRSSERRSLQGRLDNAIRTALLHPKSALSDSIPDFEARLAKHSASIVSKLDGIEDFGHVGIYSLPYGSINIKTEDLVDFLTVHQNKFSEKLRQYVSPRHFQSGVSFEHRPGPTPKCTAAITAYRNGLVAFDSLVDRDMHQRFGKTLNPCWLCYEIQRQLQLAKALLSSYGVNRISVVVELDHAEELGLLIPTGLAPSSYSKRPFGGSSEPILCDVSFPDIHDHDGPKRNVIMPSVVEIVNELSRMFGLAAAPSNVSSEDGTLAYVRGCERQR